MKKKTVKEYSTLFAIGTAYTLVELLWRKRTHWTMGIAGGVCLASIYAAFKRMRKRPKVAKCAVGCAIITSIELVFGYFINRCLGLKIWDYSKKRANFKGQICAKYSVLWFLLCIPIVPMCDAISKKINKEEVTEEIKNETDDKKSDNRGFSCSI